MKDGEIHFTKAGVVKCCAALFWFGRLVPQVKSQRFVAPPFYLPAYHTTIHTYAYAYASLTLMKRRIGETLQANQEQLGLDRN